MNKQKPAKQIALIKTGNTISRIKPRFGDFEDWFSEGLGVSDLLQLDVFTQQELPEPGTLAGVVITGSPAMVSTRQDWSERTAQWLRKAVRTDIPILGVCYGHQLLAHALGGQVGPNPLGRQIGTVNTQLINNYKENPLFGDLPPAFPAQASHSEVVLEMPPGAHSLATSPLDNHFAIQFTDKTWGVQFHPEFSAPVVSDYIRYRADALREEGLVPEQLLENVKETRKAKSVLSKFASLIN